MRVCCFRVFVDGELWDCLLILKRESQHYALYTTVDRLPFRVSAELLHVLQLDSVRDHEPTEMDANRLGFVIKTLENSSDAFKRLVVRSTSSIVTAVDNNNVMVGVKDINLVTPEKYRLAYTW